eukprot:gene26927-35624_t
MRQRACAYPIANITPCKNIDEAMQLSAFENNWQHIANGMNAVISGTKLNNRNVVIKVLKKAYPDDHLAVQEIQMEANALKCFNHPNVIDIIGCGKSNNLHFLSLEYLEGGTLQSLYNTSVTPAQKMMRFITMKPALQLDRILNIGLEFASAMKYLHHDVDPNAFFIHRDLKPDNIGFTSDGRLKIFDFGLVAIVTRRASLSVETYEMTGKTGSPRYMAPEVYLIQPYNETVDVYSFGIILWQLAKCKIPFDGFTKKQLEDEVMRGGVRPKVSSRRIPVALQNLMTKCWAPQYSKRPSFIEILATMEQIIASEFPSLAPATTALLDISMSITDKEITLDRFIDLFELRFDFADIKLTGEIARGGYGVVYGGIRVSTGEDLAVKFFGYTRNRPRMKWIMEEIKLMARARTCPNAVQILGVFYDEHDGILQRKLHRCRYPVIVMERLKGEDIFYRIINSGRFSEQSASSIFASFIQAVHYLHNTSRIINCDLKAENVVFQTTLQDDFRVKIIDFGTALPLAPDWDDVFDYLKRGTDSLMAPETGRMHAKLRHFVYSKQTDIWQAGCFLYILLLAALPFGEGEEAERRINDCQPTISHLPPFFHSSISDDAKDLILRMLDKNPSTRIKSEHILRHRWVRLKSGLSNEDLGPEYRARIRSWAYCKQLKKVLAENITAGFERKLLLENILCDPGIAPVIDISDDHSCPTTVFHRSVAHAMIITPSEFLFLQQKFVECCRGSVFAYPNLNPSASTTTNREVTFELFGYIVSSSSLPHLARKEVFEIFDQDGSMTVDYLEFLLTLIPFHLVRLYFEVFDMDRNQSISKDELQWILSKLLMISSYEQAVIAASSFDDIFRSIDTNGDGVISFEEFEAFFKVMNSRTTLHQSAMSVVALPSATTSLMERDISI